MGGQILVIDEIHVYPSWANEVKLMYDYFKDLKVIFTGSSVVDIKKGSSDLSRRVALYTMQGLSFREYLLLFHGMDVPIYTLEQILQHQVTPFGLLPLFADYLRHGYYPFVLEPDFDLKLQQVVSQTLELDIPIFADMHVSTGRKLKQLMALLAYQVPFKPNMSKIAARFGSSRNNMADYLLFMEVAGMVCQLKDDTGGIRGLGKVQKVYLDNTNLAHSLAREYVNQGNVTETFFINQVRVKHSIVSSPVADFRVEGIDFEVGGKNKGMKQIQGAERGYVVQDDIERGYRNVLPLWHVGLLF